LHFNPFFRCATFQWLTFNLWTFLSILFHDFVYNALWGHTQICVWHIKVLKKHTHLLRFEIFLHCLKSWNPSHDIKYVHPIDEIMICCSKRPLFSRTSTNRFILVLFAVCVGGRRTRSDVILFRQEVCAQSRGAELFIARLILTQRHAKTLWFCLTFIIYIYVHDEMPRPASKQLLYNMNAYAARVVAV
jgi:hypothetical protein